MTAISRTRTTTFSDPASADRWVQQVRDWSREHPAHLLVDVVREPLGNGSTRVTLVTEDVIYGPHCDHAGCPLTGCDQADHLTRRCARPETCPHCGPSSWCPTGRYSVLTLDCPDCVA
jgi:hypothetical protein